MAMAPRQRIASVLTPSSDEETSSPLPSPPPSPLVERKVIRRQTDSSFSSSDSCFASEADIARDRHDLFNLAALLPINALTLINWDWESLWDGPEAAWTGVYFHQLWAATLLYFFVDLAWVTRVPICVKSPGVIVKHHMIAMVYLLAPLQWPEYRWFMGALLTVEINTWFLIARRVVYKRKIQPPLSDIVTGLFYISWIIIRCIIYPGILLVFLYLADEGIRRTQSWMHPQLLCIPIHFVLVILNLMWTYDLFQPMIKQWLSADGYIERGVSSGL